MIDGAQIACLATELFINLVSAALHALVDPAARPMSILQALAVICFANCLFQDCADLVRSAIAPCVSQAALPHMVAWMQGAPSWAAGTFLNLPEVQEQFKHIPMDERHQQNTWTLPRALQKAEHTNKHIVANLRRHRSMHQTTAHTVSELKKPQDLGLWHMRQALSCPLPSVCMLVGQSRRPYQAPEHND